MIRLNKSDIIKHILVLMLCILLLYGHAVIRTKRPTPVLHTVFDRIELPSHYKVYAPLPYLSPQPAGPDRDFSPVTQAAARRMNTIGAICLGIGVPALIIGILGSNAQNNSGFLLSGLSVYDLIATVGFVAALGGLIILPIGLLIKKYGLPRRQ